MEKRAVLLVCTLQHGNQCMYIYPCSIAVYLCEIQSGREGETGAEGEWVDKGTRGSRGEAQNSLPRVGQSVSRAGTLRD